MHRLTFPLVLTLAIVWGACSQSTLASPERWATDIDQFSALDITRPVAPGGVVFVGSSSILMWVTLAEDFPGVSLVNRGFGGSNLSDCVHYADRIVLPYQPKVVVLYAGDNDIAGGKTSRDVLEDFRAFRRKVQTALPQTRIIYLAIKECPMRAAKRLLVREANQLIAADCLTQANCTFVDVATPLLTPEGDFRAEMFLADGLHLTPAGYAIWTQLLTPYLHRS